MIYVEYTKDTNYYSFKDAEGHETLYPVSSIILVDDSSDFISIKLVASRATVGLLKK